MSATERVVTQLNARRIREDEYRARCPVHQGKSDSSLSIKNVGDRVLLHCHSGCDLRDILAALGMKSAAELFDSVQKISKPDRETVRQQQIRRSLKAWADARFIHVTRDLRHLDEGLNSFAAVLTEADLSNEDVAETLAQMYRRRNALEYEFHVLVEGDLQRIYDELFKASR